MKTRLTLVGLLVFLLGSLVWLSIPATKVSAQSSNANAEAKCIEGCNDTYVVCHDNAVDALRRVSARQLPGTCAQISLKPRRPSVKLPTMPASMPASRE